MKPQQESFDTFGRWQLTRLRANLAPSQNISASPLYHFFADLYEDMLVNPDAYFIPVEPFESFFARGLLSPEEKAQHEALKAARMRVRKTVYAYLEFLFRLGQMGEPAGMDLQLTSEEFEKLAADYAKKVKSRHFLSALERSGLTLSTDDPRVVSNPLYPGMPAELTTFSWACARVKDFGFYLFFRCDFAVYNGKTEPVFADALRLVPQPFQAEVAETDERLRQMRFKREIFVDSGDLTYRIRYNKKNDLVVYWLRIQETFHPDLAHYLRWKLTSDLTPRLFARLEKIVPGLGNHVFMGLQACEHCYPEYCGDRTPVEWAGVLKEVCKGRGWNHIGYTRADYETLWLVLGTLNELVAK
jgi:hypothetical protein